jgi:hypothetical protein
LERRGYTVRRVRGYAAIDQGRNQMATDAMREHWDETLWIDADIGFSADDVELLRSHHIPISCALYPQKGRRALATYVMPGTASVTFGEGGGLLELLYGATGFLHVRRIVYETMERQLRLPRCNTRFGQLMFPYFQPLVINDEHLYTAGESQSATAASDEAARGESFWYLAEDFAFCHRARQCGFRIMADTRIRLRHFGSYGYSWEDAGQEMPRFRTYHFQVT